MSNKPQQPKKSRTEILEFHKALEELAVSPISKDMGEHILEEIQTRWNNYYDLCEQYDITPKWTSFAVACGTDRKTLQSWKNGDAELMNIDLQKFLSKVDAILESCGVETALSGGEKEVFSIFNMKNQHGWKNEDQAPQQQFISVQMTPEQIFDKMDALKTLRISKEKD